jgi:hypothetical protein
VTQFLKDSDAVLDYDFDWRPWLAEGETITAQTITVDDGLTLDSHSVDSGVVTVWLAGGTVRTTYKVACRITTSGGRTDERTMSIKVTNR